jgi:hypothetical protein
MATDFLSGAGSGRLLAQEFLQKRNQQRIADKRNETNDYFSNLAVQAGLEESNFNLKKQQFEFDERRRALREEQMNKALAIQAFKANKPSRKQGEEANSDADLAMQLDAAGQALMQTDPKKALEYFDQSSKFKKNATSRVTDELDSKAKKMALAGDIAGGVVDAETAAAAANELSKLGMPVNAKFTVWNPETEAFWENRATFSKNYVAKIKLQNQTLQAQADMDNKRNLIQSRNINDKLKQSKETRAQNKVDQAALTYKPSKEEFKEVKREAEVLASSDEAFEGLSEEELQLAAKEVRYLTQSIMATEDITDRGVASAKARRIIKDRITPEGTYGGAKVDETPAPSKETPADVDWKTKLGSKYKPGYRYWIENGRVKGEPI